MKYCSQCGNQLENSARFCTFCGAQTEQLPGAPAVRTPGRPSRTEQFRTFVGRYFTISDTTSAYNAKDTKDNRSTALLAYLHILILVPWFAMRESRFTQYHVKIGENLLFYQILVEILSWILLRALGWIPVLRVLLWLIVILVNAALWSIAAFGIVSAAKGRARELVNFEKFKIFK